MKNEMDGLQTLVEYELQCAIRYRRHLSIVLIAGKNEEETENLYCTLASQFRTSDARFSSNNTIAVVMSETSKLDAMQAIRRYNKWIYKSVDTWYSVSSFPNDGARQDTLLPAAFYRMSQAQRKRPGTVVAKVLPENDTKLSGSYT